MDKRAFIGLMVGNTRKSPISRDTPLASDPVFKRWANLALPPRTAIPAGLEPYGGSWGEAQAKHLLGRVLFGYSPKDLKKATSLTPGACVDALLDFSQTPPLPPLTVDEKDSGVPLGK